MPGKPTFRVDGRKLDIARAIAQTTWEQLAETSGVNTNTIYKVRHGENVSFEIVNRIAIALHRNPLDFLTTAGHPPPEPIPDPKAQRPASHERAYEYALPA